MYLNNPGMLAEDIIKHENEIRAQKAKEIAIEQIPNIKSVKDLRTILDGLTTTNPDVISHLLDELENSDDKAIQDVLNNFNELNNTEDLLIGILRELNQDDTVTSAINVLDDALKSSENLRYIILSVFIYVY